MSSLLIIKKNQLLNVWHSSVDGKSFRKQLWTALLDAPSLYHSSGLAWTFTSMIQVVYASQDCLTFSIHLEMRSRVVFGGITLLSHSVSSCSTVPLFYTKQPKAPYFVWLFRHSIGYGVEPTRIYAIHLSPLSMSINITNDYVLMQRYIKKMTFPNISLFIWKEYYGKDI